MKTRGTIPKRCRKKVAGRIFECEGSKRATMSRQQICHGGPIPTWETVRKRGRSFSKRRRFKARLRLHHSKYFKGSLPFSHFIPIPIHASSSPSTMNRHQGHRSGATTRLHHNRPCSSGDDFLDASSKWLRSSSSSNHFPPLQVSSVFNLCTSNSNYASIDIW